MTGDKDVVVIGGAGTRQQCIRTGLLDELSMDLRPMLLGGGVHLFDHLGTEPMELEIVRVTQSPGLVHTRFQFM